MPQLATGEFTVLSHRTDFSKLFDEYHGLVFRTAYRITGSAADAEDVLQTIFLRVIRRTSDLQVDSGEKYFRRAAINASLDVLRAQKADPTLPLLDVARSSDEPDTQAMRDCLRRALAKLSPRSAEIFALRHIEELSNQEIARMLDMSQVLVAVTLHRTRRRLQREIRCELGGKS